MRKAQRGFGELEAEQRGAGGEHQIEAGRYQRLVPPVNFAQPALGAIAMDGVAHGGPRGHHAHAGVVGGRAGRPDAPREEKDPAIDAAALLTHSAEVGIAPQALTGGQAHG